MFHSNVRRALAAFTYRDFRILWLGAFTSTVGTWMQKVAQAWLVFDLTQSSFYLGLDDFLGQLPILLLTLVGGVVADRHDRRRVLIGSQVVQMATALTLAALVFFDAVHVAWILTLSFVAGLGQAFGGPAYQALIPSLVEKKDLPNAIALNSTQFNLSRVLGPVAGGLVLTLIGAGWCFAVNGLSFFLVVFALTALQLPAHVPGTNQRAIGADLRSGLHYVRDNRILMILTILAFVTTFLTMPISTLLPTFANDASGAAGSPQSRLWMMMACQGLGAILGALVVGSLGRFPRMGRVLLAMQILLGLLIAAFAASRWFPMSLVLLFLAGLCSMAVFSVTFSLLQLTVPDELRGRVVSIYMVALRGGWPIGGLVAGALADVFTAPTVMIVNGLVLSVLATLMLLRRHGTLNQAA